MIGNVINKIIILFERNKDMVLYTIFVISFLQSFVVDSFLLITTNFHKHTFWGLLFVLVLGIIGILFFALFLLIQIAILNEVTKRITIFFISNENSEWNINEKRKRIENIPLNYLIVMITLINVLLFLVQDKTLLTLFYNPFNHHI